jgi:hypothetical protein
MPTTDTPNTDTPPVDIQAGALAALNDALADPAASVDPDLDDVPAVAPDTGEVEVPDGDGVITEGETEAEEVPAVEEEPPPAVDEAGEEAKGLGVKNEKALAKFRELFDVQKEYARFKEEELPVLTERAEKYDTLIKHVSDATDDPNDFGLAIGLLRAINRGGPAEWEMAVKELDRQRDALLGRLGRGPGQDPVAEFADIKEAMDNGEITPQLASELAAKRKLDSLTTQHATRQTEQQTQTQRQAEEAKAIGVSDLNDLGAHLQAIDPHFAAKRQAALDKFIAVRDTIPPQKWALEFRKVYDLIPNPAPVRQAPVGNVPLRTTGGAGNGVARVASTAQEALDLALGAYARGERA